MNIQITDKWLITSNFYCFILNYVGVRGLGSKCPGEKYYKRVGYYADLSSLFKSLISYDLRQSDITTLSEITQRVEFLQKIIEKLA